MKYIYLTLSLFLLISCDAPTPKGATPVNPKETKPSEQIDQAAENAVELIDVFSKHAKEFLEGEEMDQIKDLADELKGKGKEMLKDTTLFKAKLEELKEDKEIKELIEKYKKESESIFKSIEDILEAVEDKGDK